MAAAKSIRVVGCGAPLASGMDVEILVRELADVVRLAGLEHAQMLSAEMLLKAANA